MLGTVVEVRESSALFSIQKRLLSHYLRYRNVKKTLSKSKQQDVA